jgi:hypothetical protein
MVKTIGILLNKIEVYERALIQIEDMTRYDPIYDSLETRIIMIRNKCNDVLRIHRESDG